MKYLKKFEQKALYESYINNSPILPNVSYALDTKEVFYNQAPLDKANGVYVVTASGELVDKSEATPDCIGVALITANQRILIAKNDASNDGSNYNLYWGNNLYGKDVADITNISSGSGYIGEGKTYGTDFTTWSTGPVVDFNGKANTAAIIAAYGQHSVAMDAKDMCKVLETFNAGSDNQGFTDWYVPACGQLALMYLAKTDINAALAKIGGTAFESKLYWSSSENDALYAWDVNFNGGNVYSSNKSNSFRVRFVRDITFQFNIGNAVYQAVQGMTWAQWVNSSYNTNGYTIYNDKIYTGSEYVKNQSDFVKSDDLIQSSQYTTAIDGSASTPDYDI